jgi:hypothetical protein
MMAFARDVRVADMVVRNAPETAVPHVMLAQQIIPDQFDMGTIGNGPVPTAPRKGSSNQVYSAMTSRRAASSFVVMWWCVACA